MKKGFATPFQAFSPDSSFTSFAFFRWSKNILPGIYTGRMFCPPLTLSPRCRRFNEKNRFSPRTFYPVGSALLFLQALEQQQQRTDDIAITRASGHRFPAENPPSFIGQKPHDAGNIRPAAPRTPGSSSDGEHNPDRRMEGRKTSWENMVSFA